MPSLPLFLLALVALSCGGSSGRAIEYETGRRAAVTADGLHRVKARRIGNAYLRPGARFAGYNELLVEPVTVAYRRPPRSMPPLGSDGRGNFALEPHEMERLQRAFQEALEEELGRSEVFRVVAEPGPDTLRVTGRIVDLVIDTPEERASDIVLANVTGEMTVILDVADAQTRQPLGRLAERRLIQPGSRSRGYQRSGLSEWVEVRRLFRQWSRLLREGLEELVRLPMVPLPEEPAAPTSGLLPRG